MRRLKGSAKRLENVLIWCILVIVSLPTFFMFFWTITTAFKLERDCYTVSFLPYIEYQPSIENWVKQMGMYGSATVAALINSFVVGAGSTILTVVIASLAAYGLARFEFKRWKNRDIAFFILSQRMLPPVAVALPLFIVMRSLQLLDTQFGLILAHTLFNLPLSVWIMRDFFRGIPRELEEAAMTDGCSLLGAFWRIALPLSFPGIVATIILCFIFSWNEFLFSYFLSYQNARTVPVLIAASTTERGMEFWTLSVRTLITIIPPILLSYAIQKYLVRGLTFGAVKG